MEEFQVLWVIVMCNLMKINKSYILMQTIYMDRQYLPTGNFEKLQLPENYSQDQLVEDLLIIPDNNDYGYFIECDLEYPVKIKEKLKIFHCVLIKQKQIQTYSQFI